MIRDTFDLIYSLNLRLPTRYLLLDRSIATLASVGVELYPDFNVFEVAKPYARAMMIERFTPDKIASRARREGLRLSEMAFDLPYQVHDLLEEMRDGQIEVGFVHKGLDEFMHRIDVVFNRLVIALVVTGGLIGSSLIGIFAETGPKILGLNALSVVAPACSASGSARAVARRAGSQSEAIHDACPGGVGRWRCDSTDVRASAAARRSRAPAPRSARSGPASSIRTTSTFVACGRSRSGSANDGARKRSRMPQSTSVGAWTGPPRPAPRRRSAFLKAVR